MLCPLWSVCLPFAAGRVWADYSWGVCCRETCCGDKIVPKMQGFLESPAHLYLIPGNYPWFQVLHTYHRNVRDFRNGGMICNHILADVSYDAWIIPQYSRNRGIQNYLKRERSIWLKPRHTRSASRPFKVGLWELTTKPFRKAYISGYNSNNGLIWLYMSDERSYLDILCLLETI